MEFSWNEAQNDLYEKIVSFAKNKLNADIDARKHTFPRDAWNLAGEFGLHGLSAPENYGGMGLGVLDTARMVEAFGFGCEDMGLVFASTAHLFACVMPLVEFGSDGLKDKWLSGLAKGRLIGANAITESDAGSDVFALKSTAVRDGDFYVLNGVKSYVTNAPVADVFLVYAVTNPKFGYFGLSGFFVPRNTPGLTIGKPFEKVGLNTAPISSIYLEDCRVPATALLGEEGQGAPAFEGSMHWERACLFGGYVGAMERLIHQCVDYAKQRKQGGKAIGTHQAIAHRIADMKIRLDSARLLLYRACWLKDQGQAATMEIAMSKTAISEAAVALGLDAVQIFGGIGAMREFNIERALRDAVPSTIFSGTSEIQRNLIARELGLP